MADENIIGAEEQTSKAEAVVSEKPKPQSRSRKKAASAEPVKAPANKRKMYSAQERRNILASVARSTADGKTTVKEALKAVGISDQAYYNWKKAADKNAPAASSVIHGDELKDLVALEAENKRLRRELADKLRAENAELRRRLAQL